MRLRERQKSILAAALLAVALLSPSSGSRGDAARTVKLTPRMREALARVSADSLRGHLSFVASDALEGRNTPSRGLDIAAEYIAAQFRRAGLQPAGDDGFFQTAEWLTVERSLENFRLELKSAESTLAVDPRAVSLSFDVGGRSLWGLDRALTLAGAEVVKVDYKNAATPTPDEVGGRVVLTEIPDFRREERARQQELYRAQSAFLTRMGAAEGGARHLDRPRAHDGNWRRRPSPGQPGGAPPVRRGDARGRALHHRTRPSRGRVV